MAANTPAGPPPITTILRDTDSGMRSPRSDASSDGLALGILARARNHKQARKPPDPTFSAGRDGASVVRAHTTSVGRHPAARQSSGREDSMKELIKQYLDNGLSRRQLMSGLSALGMSTVAAKSVAQSLETFGQGATAPAAAMRQLKGTGGALFVQQLKAAGVEHIFFNPSTGDYPIFDALVDEPTIHLIKGVHEGAVVAMADGYARASGKPGVVIVANIGLPNAMTQMVNSWKDQIPVLVAVA